MNCKKRSEFLKKSVAMALVLGTSAMLNMAQAEEAPTYDLDTVVVTATKVEQSIKDVPASVTVITAKDIEKLNVQTIDQALRMAAGVFDKRTKGITDSTASVSLRGFNGSDRTLVLLDGQPLNQAYSGSVNWSSIPVQSVERIEVVKGGGSALYGASAMGGVINIITKTPNAREFQLSTQYESYSTWTQRLSIADKVSDKFSYRLGYEKKKSDGYVTDLVTVDRTTYNGYGATGGIPTKGYSTTNPPKIIDKVIIGDKGNNTWDQDTVDAKFVFNLNEQQSISLGIQHDKSEYGYEQGHTYLVKNGAAYTNNINSLLNGPGGKESNIYSLGYKDKSQGIAFNIGLTDMISSWYITPSSTAGAITGTMSDTPNRRWNIDLQKELQLGDKDRMVVGINYRNDWIHNKETNLNNWRIRNSTASLKSEAEGYSKTVGLFIQDEHKVNDKLSVLLGGRYDTWTNYDCTSMKSNTYTNYPERKDSMFSPKIAFQYKQNDDSQIHLSLSKSFNPPDLYKMYRTWVSGTTTYQSNPDLKSETVSTAELGWNKKLDDKTKLSVTYFHNDIKNLVFLMDVNSTNKKYSNAEAGRTDGVEIELNHRLNNEWTSFINYTYQDAIISECSQKTSIEGKQVTQVPKQILNLGFDYQKDKLRGNIFGSYVSKRYSKDENTDVLNGMPGAYDPYFILNTNVEYQWDKNNSVTLGVKNLLDRQYFDNYVAPGRTYSVQVSHKF